MNVQQRVPDPVIDSLQQERALNTAGAAVPLRLITAAPLG